MDTSLDLRIPGLVHIAERDMQPYDTKHQAYSATDLVSCSDDKIDVALGDAADTLRPNAVVRIGLASYHVANEATGRVFHADITAYLTRVEAQVLRKYLRFLIDYAPACDPDNMAT